MVRILTREPPPHLPQPNGAGRAGGQAGAGGGEGPGGLATPSAQSMTFQPPAPRLGPAAPPQPTRHKPVATGSPGSQSDRGSGEARPAHLSARWPRPFPGATRVPARGSAARGPRFRPRSRTPLLTGSWGRGCWVRGAEGCRGTDEPPLLAVRSAAGSGGDARAPPLL